MNLTFQWFGQLSTIKKVLLVGAVAIAFAMAPVATVFIAIGATGVMAANHFLSQGFLKKICVVGGMVLMGAGATMMVAKAASGVISKGFGKLSPFKGKGAGLFAGAGAKQSKAIGDRKEAVSETGATALETEADKTLISGQAVDTEKNNKRILRHQKGSARITRRTNTIQFRDNLAEVRREKGRGIVGRFLFSKRDKKEAASRA